MTTEPLEPPPAPTASGHRGHPGLFVSFEGGDGVGKSTQLELLAGWLRAAGHEVVTTREPGGTPLGRQLREAVLHGDHMGARAEALLYAADRAHHVDTVVRPALERGAVVLTDRYLDSSVAYQGDGRLLGAREVEQLSLWATEGLLPDLTVLLDLDPAVGLARLTGTPDRLERAGAEFHERTRRAFLARATTPRWLVVDAAHGIEAVQQQVRARTAALLPMGASTEGVVAHPATGDRVARPPAGDGAARPAAHDGAGGALA